MRAKHLPHRLPPRARPSAAATRADAMAWSITHGVLREASYPLANHSDPTLAGCRAPCNMTRVAQRPFARIDGVACGSHEEDQARAAAVCGAPMSQRRPEIAR